jgi:tetratricopeptide (TPR) repeat protein
MERQQQEKPVNDDDSEINSTLQDSVMQPSADGLGFGEENQIITLFNSDDKSTQCFALQQVKDDLSHAINEISKHVNENEKRKGKAAEDKLLMLHSLSTHPSIPTEIIDSLLKLADFKNQVQIASIAPFFGCLERIELSLNDFLSQIQVSSDSQTDNSRQKPNSGADGNGIGFVFKNRPTKIEHLSKQKDTCGDFADGHDDEGHATQIEHLENIQSDSLENEEGSYTVEMNNGSYIGSESESRTSSEPYPEMTSSVEGKSINATSTEVELIGHKCQNIDDEAEDPFVVEQSKGDDSSASSYVKNGQFLEIVGSEEKDELSSVGESIPGMYGSDSDEEEVEEITTSDEQNSEDESDDRSRSSCSEESSDASPEPKKPKSIFEKPNPKIEQFFDRLQHFFEVRRKSDERAKSIDPSMKLRNLKVKIHSGGIERKNGKYKKEFQQRNMKNEVVENMDELYSVATTAESEFKLFLLQMVQDIKGVEEGSLILPSMKPRDRAFLKAKEDYLDRDPGPPESWLFDILRAGIVCKSYKQMADVNKWLGKNCSIVQAKNRFAEPAFNGYRDLLYHISLPFQEDLSHVCELQVHHREVYALNDQFGLPKHYEFFRPCFAGSSRVQDKTLENLAMMNSYGDVGGPLMKTLLKSRDHDQLILFADLFHEVLDEFDRALELYRRVLNLQENASGTEHPNLGSTYFRMGLVLGAMGDIHQSLYHLQKAKAIQESGADSVVIAETYSELGNMLHKKGDYAKALEHYQKALSIQKAKLGKRHFLAIKSLHHIGLSLKEMGLFEKAEKAYSDALQLQKDVLGETHPDVAKTHSLIGAVLCEVGHFQEAMEEYRHALSICEASLGKNHPLTADAHTHIGSLLQLKGEYEFAEWRYRKALRIQEAMLGKDHQNCASSHGHLGEVLSYQGKFEEAVMELKRAQEIQEATIGRDNPITSCSYIDLGNVYYSMGKYTEALKEYRRAKVIRESILGPHHPDTAAACICIGNVLVQQGNIENAVMEQKGAVAIFESVLGKSHPKTALAYESMARALEVDGSKEDALIQHRKALSIRANVLAKEHPDTASSCLQIGELLYKNGDGVGALVAFQQALAITIQVFGEEHINSATAHIKVGQVLMEQGKIHEAKQEIQQGLHVRLAKLPADHVDIGQTYMLMGSLYSMSSEFEKAAECHRKSKQILTNKLGKNHPEAQSARRKLDLAEKKQKE